jgi:hypothetical protein
MTQVMRAANPVPHPTVANPCQQDHAVRHGRHHGHSCAIAYHLREGEADANGLGDDRFTLGSGHLD